MGAIVTLVLATLVLAFSTTAAFPALEFTRAQRAAPIFITSSSVVSGAINVHLQPHTHNDLGWLKTFDEYLTGANNTIQAAGVKYIYDSVLQALLKNPDRRFITVEMGFLMRWLDLQPPSVVAQVQQLVAEDRLQLCNAGWTMHDEATVGFSDAVDQYSLGARLANRTFGPAAAARVAWSIDPFGHGATQGVLTSQMGYSGFFYGRLDWQEKEFQIANNATEYVWRPSASLGATAQVFAGSNVHGYDPPTDPATGRPLFEWDVQSDNPYRPALLFGPLQPYPDLDQYNVQLYVAKVLQLAADQATYTLADAEDGTVHLAWQMGTDFNYMQSEMWFSQMDALISAVNANQSRVHLLYSTPRNYMDAKLAQRTAWPLKPPALPDGLSTDQFPLANNPHWLWTGYFSSRPALKHLVRYASSLFASGRQLQAFTGGVGDALAPSNPLYALERALATAQHHDAVTGTSRQHVAYDYAKQLSGGINDAIALLGAAARRLTRWADGGFSLCLLANATICPPLEAPTPGAPPTMVLLYNALSYPRRTAPVRLPVALSTAPAVASWRVTASDGATPITAQLLPPSAADLTLREKYYDAPAVNMTWLAWLAPEVPPLGYAAFFLEPVAAAGGAPHTHASHASLHRPSRAAADQVLTNGVVSLTFDGTSGLVAAIDDAASGLALPLSQSLFYHRASPGCPQPLNIPYGCPVEPPPTPCTMPNDGTGANAWGQSSTTYIFRPNSTAEFSVGAVTALHILLGPVVNEARQEFEGAWVSNVVRLWGNTSTVESEWTVGAMPLGDGWGKEVFTRWALGGGFGGALPPTLYHDSMGRELQKRVLNARPFPASPPLESIAANLYPVTARAVLLDAPPSTARATLAVDRAQACASLATGAVQCLLHRRHLTTAFLGMGEVLDEKGLNERGSGLVVRGTHLLRLGSAGGAGSGAAAEAGSLRAAEELQLPLAALLAPLPGSVAPAALPAWAASHALVFAGLNASALSPNLRVLTLQPLGGATLLLRVAHAHAVGEDPALAANGTAALGPLFAPAFSVVSVMETSAGGVVPLDSVKPWTMRVQGEAQPVTLPIVKPKPVGPRFEVALAAGEVRTFVCEVEGGGYA
jgi:hypothetical protein